MNRDETSIRCAARLKRLSLTALLGIIAGCGNGGSSSTAPPPLPPPVPVLELTVTKVQGDGQMRFPGSTLVQELVIQLNDASGSSARQAGLPVSWTVRAGGGQVTASSSATDGAGSASASLTLGHGEGENRLEATIDGVGSVIFSAHAKEQGGPIAFSSGRYGNAFNKHILVMEPDGSDVMAVTSGAGIDQRPQWSPDGQWIAFTRGRGGINDIFVINADGIGEARLTSDGNSANPTWSSDGSKIAYHRGVPDDYHIWVMNSDGSEQRMLTDRSPEFTVDFDPHWSPDGAKIVFVRFLQHVVFDNDVFVMNADGTDIIQLTNDGHINWLPKWSPDGAQIIYQYDGIAVGAKTRIMNADGSGQRPLTTGLPGGWSADGQSVLVFDDGVGVGEPWDVFKVDVQTGERENLTEHPASDNWPVWRW